MKKQIFIFAVLFISAISVAQTGNVGVGTTSPGSKLTVSGSLSLGYINVTGNYSLTDDDYFVVYSGSSPGTVSLPFSKAIGSGNFKGRVYKIKNSNAIYSLAIYASGSELISGNTSIALPPAYTAELISTGATSGNTWEVINIGTAYVSDQIRTALANGGCTSCGSYDAAVPDTWLQITSAEYNSILSSVSGASAYGSSSSIMAATQTNSWTGGYTVTENFSQQTQVPASHFPMALSIRTGTGIPTSMAGLKLKVSSVSQTSGYTDLPAGTATPNVSGTLAANTIYYFVLKKPSTITASSASSNLAIYTPLTHQLGNIGLSGTSYYGFGDVSTPNNLFAGSVPAFQVISTPNRQW